MSLENMISNPKVRLQNVEAKVIPLAEKENRKVEYFDEFEFSQSENLLIINYKRNVGFNTKDVFSVRVEYSIFWNIDNNLANELKRKLSNLTDEEKNFLLGEAPYEASLLISQITKALDFMPMITPPIFADSKE